MKRICAWCNIELPLITDDRSSAITHGICADCAERVFKSYHQNTVRKFIDEIEAPIIVIQNDTTIALTNKKADKMLEAERGNKTGDALECSCANLPGGCGKTIHCKACTIRRTIQKTRKTGKSYSNITAYQNVDTPKGTKHKTVTIATEKIWDTILVRVDELTDEKTDDQTKDQNAPWT